MRPNRLAGHFARRRSAVAHAALALCVLAAALAGFAMTALPPGALREARSVAHGSLGLAALLAALLWPWLRNPRAAPIGLSAAMWRLARAMHLALWLGVLGLALGGILLKWRMGAPIGPFPPLPFAAAELLPAAESLAVAHRWLARTLLAAAVLHAFAALRHLVRREAWGQSRRLQRITGQNPS
jgi:cytochrome b561